MIFENKQATIEINGDSPQLGFAFSEFPEKGSIVTNALECKILQVLLLKQVTVAGVQEGGGRRSEMEPFSLH